jgi:hypothetical protein
MTSALLATECLLDDLTPIEFSRQHERQSEIATHRPQT